MDAIKDELGDLACEQWLGPLVILLFDDEETYTHYVSPADPELEAVRSAGICFKHGYVHIAIHNFPLEELQSTLLHEITHACLSHLKLRLRLFFVASQCHSCCRNCIGKVSTR